MQTEFERTQRYQRALIREARVPNGSAPLPPQRQQFDGGVEVPKKSRKKILT